MSSSPSPPAAPDYVGAANATAAGNLQNTIAADQGSMVNQNTPYGSLDYSQIGNWASGNPEYQADTTLTPIGQTLLNNTEQAQAGLGGAIDSTVGTVQNDMSQPMDLSSIPQVEQQSYASQMGLLGPQIAQSDAMEKTALANQGLVAGGEAYDNAERTQGVNDASLEATAANNAISTAPTTLQMSESEYNQPLNELEALLGGTQVQNPTFTSTPSQAVTPGANLSGAAAAEGTYNQGLYNAEVGQTNAQNAGLYSLGAAGLGALGSSGAGAALVTML